jgi:hypothetical protein
MHPTAKHVDGENQSDIFNSPFEPSRTKFGNSEKAILRSDNDQDHRADERTAPTNDVLKMFIRELGVQSVKNIASV